MSENGWKILKLPLVDVNSVNSLFVLDDLKPYIPSIKRVYFMCASDKGVKRGYHAHKKLNQLIIVITGSYEFVLENQFGVKNTFLITAGEGLFIFKPVWRVFTSIDNNSSFITLCSDHYDKDDYIRDYEEFKQGNY